MIFLLMTVLILGTCQARSEAAHFKNAGLKLPSWISQGSHSFFADVQSADVINVFIVGPVHACQADLVTLTAFVSGTQSDSLQYQWRLNGQAIPGATSSSYTFLADSLPALAADTLAYDFDVYVWGADCEATYSAVHLFTVSPTPVILIDVPVACEGEEVMATATAYTSGFEQPYMWIWDGDDTTYVNTHMFTSGEHTVAALYQNFSCNVDPTPFTVNDTTYTLEDISLDTASLSVCAGALVSFTLTDPNDSVEVSYAWYVDGVQVPNVTGKEFAFNAYGEGESHKLVVVATYPCNNVKTDTATITVFNTPSVVITGDNAICNGTQAHLIANVLPSGENYSFLWSNEAGQEQTANVYGGTYTVTVTDTVSGCAIMADPFTVTEFGTDVILSASEQFICKGESVVLNANTDGWSGNVAYKWSTNDTTASIIVTPDSTTTYTVTATLNNDTSCTVVRSIQVIVNPKPEAPAFKETDFTICQNAQATIEVNNPAQGAHFTWYLNGIEIPGENLSSITLNFFYAGTYTVNAAVVDANGCVSDLSATAATVTVNPAPSLVQISGNNVICQGDTAALTASVLPADLENVSYSWSNGKTVANVNVPAGVYTVTATVGDCQAVATDFTVWAFGSDVQVTASATQVCAGEAVILNANADGWTGDVTYTWSNGATGSTITVYPEEDTTIYIVTTTLSSSNGGDCTREDSIAIYVSTIEAPTIVNENEDTVCEGTMITLTAEAEDAASYVWYHNGVMIAGENLETLSMNLMGAGEHLFAVRAINANGCPSDLSDPDTITVEAAPVAVTITGNNVVCQGAETTLTASATGEGEFTYVWSDEDATEGEELTISHAGVYTVTASSENGCVTVSDPFTVTAVGANVIIEASATSICAGQAATLTAIALDWTGNVTYAWSVDGETVNGSTVNVAPTETTSYVVTTTSTLSNDTTCQRTDTVTIVVLGSPDAPTVSVTSGSDVICEGSQVTLTAEVEGDAVYTYTWYENGIEIPGQNLDVITVSPAAGTYEYAVKAVSADGCPSLASAGEEETATVTVLHNPTIAIMGDAMVCDTTPVVLIANINDTTMAGDNFNYDWRIYNYSVTSEISFPNIQAEADQVITTLDSAFNTSALTAQDEPYIITVSVTNENGCVATSAPFYLYVGMNPTVAVTVDFDTICQNGMVTATAHLGDYNMDHLVYQWYTIINNDTVAIPYGTSPSVTFNVTEDAQIYVEVTQTTTGCFATGYDSVIVVNPPQVSNVLVINNGNLAEHVCEGAEVFVTAYLVDEDGNQYIDSSLNYVWYENGFLMPLVDGPSFNKQLTIVDEDAAHYVYQAFINYGMPGCEAVPVASDTIFVKRNPIVVIDGVHHICFQGINSPNVHLTAWVDGETDLDATYNWYKNGMLTHNDLTFLNLYNEMLEPSYQDPYTFMVEVINGDGCSSFSEPFVVNIHDIPYVNITASETEICQGGDVLLRANLNDYNETELTFQWYMNELNNNHIMPGYTHEFQTMHPDVTTDYIVEVKHLLNDNTNEYSVCAAYDTITIVVNDIPVVDSITTDLAEGNTVCEGAQFTLTAHISGGVAGGETYTWYRNGEFVQNTSGPTLTDSPVTVDGDVTVYNYTVSVAQTAAGCESVIFSTPVAVTINPNPTLAIETDPIVCTDSQNNITLVAHLDPAPATTFTYTWYEDNAVIASGSSNDTLVLTRPYRDYPYNFSVSTVNEYGCHATATTEVYVNDNPVVNIDVTEETICEGGEITLTAHLNDWNADQMVYQWYDGNTAIAGATSLTYTVVPTVDVHKYTFRAEQLTSGCAATSDTLTVTVNADPVIDSISTDLTDGTVLCEGAQFTLTAHVSGGVNGGEIYTWYRNGEIIEGATGATYTDSPVAVDGDVTVYNYTVAVAQTAAGCGSAVFATPVAITINPNPTLAIETDPIVCVATENNITLIAHVDPTPATPFTYTWYEDNSVIASENDGTLTITRPYRDYAYNFSVSTVNEYGCNVSASTVVYVNDNPVVNISVSENNICEGGAITLTADLNDWNADQLVYQWFDGENLIPGATSLSYTLVPAVGTHNYSFKVDQLTSGCTATSEPLTVNVYDDPEISSVTLSSYVACQGAQVTITANVEPYDAQLGDAVYTWYRNGVLIPGATAQTIYDSPVTVDNNTQQFVYTAVVTLTASGCQSDAVSSSALTIYPNPTVQITGDQHVCVTTPVSLIANVDTIGTNVGLLHYTWYESGQIRDNMAYNLGDNQFYMEYFYARTEPYRFTVNVERDGVPAGCASMSQEFLVWVYEQPVVNVTATETEICTNGEVTLTANLNDYNATNITYQWYEVRTQYDSLAIGYTDGGEYIWYVDTTTYHYNIPGATSATYTTNLTETTTLGVFVQQTPSQCYDSDEITIIVNPIPVVTDITVNGEHAITVCDGAQVTVAATIDPADAEGAVYTWYRNGELIPGATQASFSENVYTTPNHITTNMYTAIVTLPASGCVSTISTMAGIVTIMPAPTTVTISGNNVICEGDSTTLYAYSDVEGTWTWSNGSHADSITVPAGVYTVTMTTPEGCEMTSEPFAVEALGTDLFVTASATHICQGEHTTLYATQDGWAGNVTYLWDAQAGNSTANTVDVQPDTTTTYHVTATVSSTNGSCNAEGTITIIVTPLPEIVEVTALTPTTICEGEQVTLHASGNAYSYIWYVNGVVIPGENQADLTVLLNEAGTYAYAAKAVNEEGCVSAEASEPVIVTVNAAPESVEISGQLVICDGGFTTLYANVTPNVPATYVWYKDNVVIPGATDSILIVTEAGSYRVDATTNGCTTSSPAVVVTVELAPQVELTATETTICEGGVTVITAEPTGYNNDNVIYTWSNGFVGSAYTFYPTVPGDYTFYVTASQATSGCNAVDSITIHVDAAPAAPVVDLNYTQICDGGQVIMTVTNDYTSYGNPVFTWYRNGVVIPGATMATFSESPVAIDGDVTTYTYNVTVAFAASGCVSAASAPAVVTVIPTPVVAIQVVGNTTICEGGSTTLQANVTPAGVEYGYQWYVNNVLIPGATNASLTVSPAANENPYNYTVVVTAAPGCIVTSEATAITVVTDPVVVATVDNAITCVGGTATFTATVDGGVANINGLNGYTFAWYSNFSSNEPIATTPTYTTTGNEAADAYSYWVVVTSPYGCQTMSNVVNYTVVADPVVTVAVAQGYPTTVCDGGVTTLIANVTGGYGTPSYQWYKNGIQLYGETNPTLVTDPIVYNQTADYTVVVTQTGVGCESVSAAFNVNVVPSYTVDVTGYDNVCVGGTVTMTAQVNGMIPGDVLTYQWYTINNGTQTAIYGANAPQYTTSPLLIAGAYEYFVVVTSSISGCSVTQSYSVNANVVPDPTVQIVANGSAVICDGGNITLNAIVNGGVNNAGYVYTWTWFGAASGSAVTNDPTYTPQLAANDPANPYYFVVSIARADNSGCASSSDAFQVNVLAAPSVQITADHAYVCAGGNVTFTAHVAESGSSYNYVWTINGETQATNSNTITTSLPTAGDINVSVVVSNTNSSVSCSSVATLTVPVHVVADPVVTIAANHTTMCAGGTTTLSVQNITLDSNIPADFSYQWAINGYDIPGAINNTFVQSLTDAGTYNYTLKVTVNGDLGCISTWSAPVTVQVAEQPSVSLNSDYGLDICEGGTITLTGTVDNFGNTVGGVLNNTIYGPMTFNWTSNGISTQVNTNVTTAQNQYTDTLDVVGNYSYQVIVTPSGYACQPAYSNIQTVNVVASPSWTDIHVLYPDVCVNSIVYLEAGIQGGTMDHAGNTNGQIQWTVTFNGVTSNVSGGVGGNSYDLPTVAGDYIYTPTWIGNIGSGCAFTNTAEAQTFVTVHDLPTASFDSSSYNQTICGNVSDASAALVINFTGTAPFTFQLQDLETGIILPAQVSGTNTYTVHVAPGHTTQYRIIMVSDQYCENGSLDNSDAIITVFVNDIEFDQTMFISGCDDDGMVTIHFNMLSGTPNSDFVVTYANGETYTGTINNNTATFQAPAAPGDYPAVFSVDGCNYDIVIRVLVGEYGFGGTLPIMDQRWHDVVVVNNNPETNGGHTFVGYQWYRNGILIPGAIYSNYQELGGLNGFYSVELIEQGEDGSMVTYMTCETYFSSASTVRAYPVPATVNQEITLELDLSAEEMNGAVLDIYNVTGSLINHVSHLEPITKISGFHAQGTYFGRILTGTNEIKTVKFVIVK